ncbi:MAG: L-threonylcarbamoyladenylate synthase [Patescibacteria group bacterium]|nr:L-threonylcarbamoyladenylate synthase [Patescibacteria group bacterium]
MRVLRVSRSHVSNSALREAVTVLRRGGVVVFPTETAYGLAADPANRRAVARIYRIKGRNSEKKLPLVASSAEQVRRAVVLRGQLKQLAEKHWPGPLTVVAPAKHRPLQHSSTPAPQHFFTIAVRVPGSALVRRLCREFGTPLTATSANLAGHPTLYSGAAVRKEFAGRRHQPDLLLDAGRLPRRPPSTIVGVRKGRLVVLRQGGLRIGTPK